MYDSSIFVKSMMSYMQTTTDFKNNVSTAHAILDVVTSAYENISDDFYTDLAMVDLKKAFDTASHSTLTLKLNNFGIRGVAYQLIHSYLHNRKQFVKINQNCSDKLIIDYVVPKHSSLGLLFSEYMLMICRMP